MKKVVKFILTKEVGRLCRWLRILGFDAEYFLENNLATLIIKALRENRVIVTRKKKIDDLKVIRVYANDVKEQLREVLIQLELRPDEEKMFTRCVICNKTLEKVEKEEVKEKVPLYVYQTQNEFYQCPSCRRIYWQGTHWGNVKKIIQDLAL
ncbi:MAG: hypothetical protein B6D56_01825 [Candidatus Omnitrophica bacterium 4484_70.1]|nr:MAG: hypothetical protein B6D56_01825 [Candidatus Omnitrophica bacterium 4484_70.1]